MLDFWLQVDSTKYGTLLEVVQMLTNLKLTINQAYISSDRGWFMDGECRASASFPTVFGKFKKIDERKMVPLWGDAKSGFCLGCDLSILLFFSNPDV